MGDCMNLILTTILQEQQRIEYMLERYQEEISKLPRGTISEKQTNGKTYYYLKYRDGKKVVSQYIKKDEIEALRKQIERRRHMEKMIKSLQEELGIAKRALEGQQ